MKTITTKRMIPKFIEVQSDDFEIVEEYQAEDGKVFSDLGEAVKHESQTKFNIIEKTSFWFPTIDDTWYKARDQKELDFLVNRLSVNYGGRRYGVTKLKPGEWFTHVAKDRDGVGTTADHFVPLSKLKECYAELLKLLEKE